MDMEDSSFKFPERFFSGMAKLKVLSLNFLPSPIILPIGLQTLCLDGSEIEEVAIIGELKKLKILSLRYCYNIKQLPGEISQLIELRLLDLSDCENLEVITPDVISSLVRLEELYMSGCFVQWEVRGPNVKRNNASLEELLHLSCLTALEIDIEDEKILPKGFFSKKLERYSISIGYASHCVSLGKSFEFIQNKGSRGIAMKLNSSICLEKLQGINNVESLCLGELQNVKSGLQELDNDGFSQLKHLCVQYNHNLLCLVDSTKCVTAFPLLESLILCRIINLEKICKGQPTTDSFCNLKFIKVNGCDELTILFSFSTAKSLPQLQRLEVEDCKNVKEIFAIEREGNVNNGSDKIEFFQLRFLTLKHLPRLASFCSGMTTTSTSQSRHDELTLFDEKVSLMITLYFSIIDINNFLFFTLSEKILNKQLTFTAACFLQFGGVRS
ncbi:hypothetical protein Pint_20015 [Pistacia integerrima]|uniref:Uncharacterized protein n=1 Tax=Pistacia integerrima TaxID=434235 RepID=A0ACC0X9X4_9ROSI|nr:hypothetical protein Pint_20015 [Pistacia integerrima]